jgi:hypothetical protein
MKNVKGMKNPPKDDLHVHALHGENALLWLAVGLCFVLGALLGWRQIASPDIGFHLSTARWMVEHRAWPVTDLFSFTFTGHPYLDLQWLFQLTLYGANALGGTGLIVALKTAVTLLFWALLVVRSRRANGGAVPWSAPLLLILVALGDYSEERPHLFSWVYGSLVLLVLEEFGRGNRRWLPALPLILLCWVNSHQLFVLGLVMIGVSAAWELRKGLAADRALLGWALASVAACLVNPYHVRGLLFPLTLFGEIQSSHVFAGASMGITELQPPFSTSLYYLAGRFVLFQPPLYWHIYTALIVVGLIGAWRRARLPDLVMWALFAWVFSRAHKNFGYFVMATFPLAAIGIDRVVFMVRAWIATQRAGRLATPASPAEPRMLLVAPIVMVLALVPLVPSGWLYRLGWGDAPIGTGYNSRFLPRRASEFLNAPDRATCSRRLLTAATSTGRRGCRSASTALKKYSGRSSTGTTSPRSRRRASRDSSPGGVRRSRSCPSWRLPTGCSIWARGPTGGWCSSTRTPRSSCTSRWPDRPPCPCRGRRRTIRCIRATR